MKHITLTSLIIIITTSVYSQTLLNGDFEDNTSSGCQYNLMNSNFNATMNNCFAFGLNDEIDIQNSSCGMSNPAHGNWFISLSTNPSNFNSDGLSLFLNTPFISGNMYQISYFEKADITYYTHTIDSLYFGVSSDSSVFGTQIYSSQPTAQIGWTQKNFNFIAPLTAQYLTIKNKGALFGWNFIDDLKIVLNTGTDDYFPDESVKMSPNPTNGSFSISIPPTVKQIEIYNSIGQLIQTKNTEGLSNLNFELEIKGVYLINILTNKQTLRKKLIVYK